MKYIRKFDSVAEMNTAVQGNLINIMAAAVVNGTATIKNKVLPPQPNDEIWYMSTDGSVVTPYSASFGDGVTVVSNTYSDGRGVIKLSGPATTIGENAFSSKEKLKSINIPNTVTSIGRSAFWNCYDFESVVIPDSVLSIGVAAFNHCEKMSFINLPNSLTTLGNRAFFSCYNLKSIHIPSSVTSIGFDGNMYMGETFSNCSNLFSITVDQNNSVYDSRGNCNAIIETANNKLIVGCINTVIPNTVTIIGKYAFDSRNFTTINIPSSVTNIEDSAFSYSGLVSCVIPNSVTNLGSGIFLGCENLSSVTLPENITSLSTYLFGRTKLTSFIVPNTVTTIGHSVFSRCGELASVVIPSSVTSMGDYVFENCNKLTSLTIFAVVPPTVTTDSFEEFPNNCTIYVPAASVEDYKAANIWKYLASRIQAIPS